MTYRKPELVAMAPAVAAIQSDTQKVQQITLDNQGFQAASLGYEADE
jgi:hypothetical protein